MPTSDALALAILDALDAERLERCGFYFGGGAHIALTHETFRIS